MNFSSSGKNLLIELEGKRDTLYYCSAGRPTIGVGCVVDAEKYKGIKLTDKEIYDLLDSRIVVFENVLRTSINVPINQNQFDALICFMFNVGTYAFKKSTLLRRLNNHEIEQVPSEMEKFVYATDKKTLKKIKVKGLVARREKEIALFTKK